VARKKDADGDDGLDGALAKFQTRWAKKGATVLDPRDSSLKPGPVSTGIVPLDDVLGGGIPRGRTTTVYGEYSSGKTLFCQLVIANAQREGDVCIFVDAERTFDPDWFALTGVDLDPTKLLVVRPRTLEECFDLICDALQTVRPAVLVMDSIPALVPKDMLKVEMSKQDFQGLHARKMTEGIRKANLSNDVTALIYVNQLRVNMGVKFGNPESLPGGKGIGFYSSVMIRVRRGRWLYDVEENEGEEAERDAQKIGFVLRVRAEKNKVAIPWRECELEFTFNGKVDPVGALIRLAIERGVIVTGAAGYYEVVGLPNKVHGLDRLKEVLRGDDEVRATIESAIQNPLAGALFGG